MEIMSCAKCGRHLDKDFIRFVACMTCGDTSLMDPKILEEQREEARKRTEKSRESGRYTEEVKELLGDGKTFEEIREIVWQPKTAYLKSIIYKIKRGGEEKMPIKSEGKCAAIREMIKAGKTDEEITTALKANPLTIRTQRYKVKKEVATVTAN